MVGCTYLYRKPHGKCVKRELRVTQRTRRGVEEENNATIGNEKKSVLKATRVEGAYKSRATTPTRVLNDNPGKPIDE